LSKLQVNYVAGSSWASNFQSSVTYHRDRLEPGSGCSDRIQPFLSSHELRSLHVQS
jgi:hypothetical protein